MIVEESLLKNTSRRPTESRQEPQTRQKERLLRKSCFDPVQSLHRPRFPRNNDEQINKRLVVLPI